jgi:methylmalonyl-CoA/ethylmalonyl-CoA epimerase
MDEKSVYSNLHHVCLIVKDIDMAIDHYRALGIGPFQSPPVKTAELTFKDKPVPPDYFKRWEVMGKMGAINLQLCQPISGNSPWQQFLDAKGECVHHLGFFVDDIKKEIDQFKEAGFEVILASKFVGGGGAAYIDISKTGDFYIELIQPHP